MQVRSLGREDPLEEGMATHSCIIAWRIPWTEEPGGLQSMGSQRVGQDLTTWHAHTQKTGPSPSEVRPGGPNPMMNILSSTSTSSRTMDGGHRPA